MITVHIAGPVRDEGGQLCSRCGRLISTIYVKGDRGSWPVGQYVERDEHDEHSISLRLLSLLAPGEVPPMLCEPLPDLDA